MSTLERFRATIEEEVEYLDLKPYSHNIISMTLRAIAKNFGKDEANKAIKDFGLNRRGWSIIE